MQHQIQTKDKQREQLMMSLKTSQTDLLKCRRELNKERNSKSAQMKLLKKSHSDAVQDKQKLIEELNDVLEEKEGVIDELTAQLQGDEVNPKRGKTNSVRQLVDQISKLHGEKAALKEAVMMSRQECETLHQELKDVEKNGRSSEKRPSNGMKLEPVESQAALIRDLQEENGRLREQLEESEDTGEGVVDC